jgi:multicomponent Na+:H+ antiporter subunit D
MARVWADAFWRPPAKGWNGASPGGPLLATIAALSVLTIAVTIGAEPLFALTSRAAAELLDPQSYITAVLGGAR